MGQQSFSSLDDAHKTKRESFLGEMDAVVPWGGLEGLIAPHYTKSSNAAHRDAVNLLFAAMVRTF
jgi:hypothetical protein